MDTMLMPSIHTHSTVCSVLMDASCALVQAMINIVQNAKYQQQE